MINRIPLFVYGAGGHGKVVADAARAGQRFDLHGFLDDDPSRRGAIVLGLPVLGGLEAIQGLRETVAVALGVGPNAARLASLFRVIEAGRTAAIIIHPCAFVASGVTFGDGTFVAPLAAVHTDARLGRACIINTGAVVEHDNVLGDGVHLSPNSALGGDVTLGDGVHVGLGAVVLPGVSIGARSVVGAGAAVIDDVPEGTTVVGVPARAVSGAAARSAGIR